MKCSRALVLSSVAFLALLSSPSLAQSMRSGMQCVPDVPNVSMYHNCRLHIVAGQETCRCAIRPQALRRMDRIQNQDQDNVTTGSINGNSIGGSGNIGNGSTGGGAVSGGVANGGTTAGLDNDVSVASNGNVSSGSSGVNNADDRGNGLGNNNGNGGGQGNNGYGNGGGDGSPNGKDDSDR